MIMSQTDQQKWDKRYREGAYAERPHPSAWLLHCLANMVQTAQGTLALDLACGAGRNSIYLARLGYRVDAVDIAGEALRRGKLRAQTEAVTGINWLQQDLDDWRASALSGYGLVLISRYLDLTMVTDIAGRLLPGGYLICEVHLQTSAAVAGPAGNEFRAAPGALKAAAGELEMIEYSEGLVTDPDGSVVAVARLLATKAQGSKQ
jgi:tellurite methyltransferase